MMAVNSGERGRRPVSTSWRMAPRVSSSVMTPGRNM